MKMGVLIIVGALTCLASMQVFAASKDKWCAVDTRTGVRIQGVNAPIPFDVVEQHTCGKPKVMKFQYSTTSYRCVILGENPDNPDELYQLDVPCTRQVQKLTKN